MEKSLVVAIADNCELICLKKDEDLGLITLFVEVYLVHHIIGNKSAMLIWDNFHTIFGAMNITQSIDSKIALQP